MKRFLSIILAITMILSLSACGTTEGQDSSETSEEGVTVSEPAEPNDSDAEGETSSSQSGSSAAGEGNEGGTSNILVAYFSWADNAILAEDVDAVASPSVVAPEMYSSWQAGYRRKLEETYSLFRLLNPIPVIGISVWPGPTRRGETMPVQS